MILNVAEVLGLSVDTDVANSVTTRLFRIAERVKRKSGEPGFEEEVIAADAAVGEESGRAMMNAFAQCSLIEAPQERVYKIARSEKGKRIEERSESGVRFSFGPKWVDAVVAAKGIALNEHNREKLNMHGKHVGIENPENMTARELCAAIAGKIQ
jgi:hypothetical protein